MSGSFPGAGEDLFNFDSLEELGDLDSSAGVGSQRVTPPPSVVLDLSAEEQFWLKLPEQLISQMNLGAREAILEMVSQHFSEDCILRTTAMDEAGQPDRVGRDSILEFFLTLGDAYPDMTIRFQGAYIEYVESDVFALCFSDTFVGIEAHPDEPSSDLYKSQRNVDFVEKVVQTHSHGHLPLTLEAVTEMQKKQQDVHVGRGLASIEVEAMGRLVINRTSNRVVRFDNWWVYKSFDSFEP
jgi:hypothetical protein